MKMKNTVSEIPYVIARCNLGTYQSKKQVSYFDVFRMFHSMDLYTEVSVSDYFLSDGVMNIQLGYGESEIKESCCLGEFENGDISLDKMFFHCRDIRIYNHLSYHKFYYPHKAKCFLGNDTTDPMPISNSRYVRLYESNSERLISKLIELASDKATNGTPSSASLPVWTRLIVVVPGNIERYLVRSGISPTDFYRLLINTRWVCGICTDEPIKVSYELRQIFFGV